MSNWTTITATNLTASAASGKVGLIQAAASARSLPDPAAAAISIVTTEIRSAIGFSGKYTVDSSLTAIPGNLVDLAVKKVIREMTRAVQMALTADEQADERTYETRLGLIRKGEWPIDAPDNPIVTGQAQVGPAAAGLSSQHRQFKPREMRGL